MPERVSLAEAVEHVRPGDVVHVVTGHTRWTAAARSLCRRFWGDDPGLTLVMLSLSSLGTLFFRGGLVRKVVTGYSGDIFPNFTPNPVFADAYRSGEVEVEHWPFLAFLQRLEAAARGYPALVTRSVAGSSMEENEGFARVPNPFGGGDVGLVAPLRPDVALVHGAVADTEGNVAFSPPDLEGFWGAWAARRGAVVTVEAVVDDLRPWSHLVRLPAHRVVAVVEAPFGAHPGGLFVRDLPVEPYGEDVLFWSEAREMSRRDDFDQWIDHWVLGPATHEEYLERLGPGRLERLRARAMPDSWRADAEANPPDLDAPVNSWERATVFGARYLADRTLEHDAQAVLAGAGVANLATWLGVELARQRGSGVKLTAELGLWDYEPTDADPYVFNHRSFPTATMLVDTETVLGMVVPGPGTRTLACLGAAVVDRVGNVNSTEIPGGPFLVGSGGGNDVASAVDEVIVVATLTARRTAVDAGYVTSPGDRVRALVTDHGVFEKDDSGELVLTAAPGDVTADDVRRLVAWELRVAEPLAELPPPSTEEVARLRRWDPQGVFLRP